MKRLLKIKRKLALILAMLILAMPILGLPVYSFWGKTEKGGIYWVDKDNTIAIDGWKLIDDDGDGIGYYYYFNKNGFILLDDITPDYKIVNKEGKRIDYDGNPIAVKIEDIKMEEGEDNGVYSAEIMEQIKAEQDTNISTQKGVVSSGTYLFGLDQETLEGPKPSDNLVIEKNADGSARWILGPNVTLKKKADEAYDRTMDKKMQNYIVGGDKYSKSVNGTTYLKSKWKACMALKGTGASITFENPKHNFNMLKGRIATHYFSYTETTTQCTLTIYNDDTGEDLYSTSDFNYNGGCQFSCIFPKKAEKIRFELDVQGTYTSRVAYLRDCEYGFDKDAYEDELYQDENERIYIERYGTESEAEYIDYDDEEIDDGMGEKAVEGEDPSNRYKRLNGITDDDYWLTFNYDEEDDTVTEAMKASISEAKARYAAKEEERNKVSGPAFDEALIKETEALGPLGASRYIPGKEGG